MTRKLQVGDIVLCQFYNTPDKRFYGEVWKAEICGLTNKYEYIPARDFLVKDELGRFHTVLRKEIKRRIKNVKEINTIR